MGAALSFDYKGKSESGQGRMPAFAGGSAGLGAGDGAVAPPARPAPDPGVKSRQAGQRRGGLGGTGATVGAREDGGGVSDESRDANVTLI